MRSIPFNKVLIFSITITLSLTFTLLTCLTPKNSNAAYTLPTVEYKTIKVTKTSSNKIQVSFKAVSGANRYKIVSRSGKNSVDEYIWYYDTTDSTTLNTRKYTFSDESISTMGGIDEGELKFLRITPFWKMKGATTKSGETTVIPYELPFSNESYSSSLRVGSYNVFYYPYYDNQYRSYSTRARRIAANIKNQSLDIVGLQESYFQYGRDLPTKTYADNSNLSRSFRNLGKYRAWVKVSTKEFNDSKKKGKNFYEKKYRKIKESKKQGKTTKAYYLKKVKIRTERCSGTSNQIIYNKKKLTLLACGQKTLDNPNQGDNHHRYVQYSKFKVKKTGKILFFFNTHLTISSQYVTDKRIKEAKKINKYIKDVAKKSAYILVGDINTTYSNSMDTAVNTLNNSPRTQALELTAQKKTKIEYKTNDAFYNNIQNFKGSKIDHIFVSDNITPLSYKLIYKTPGVTASDHQLIWGEIGI